MLVKNFVLSLLAITPALAAPVASYPTYSNLTIWPHQFSAPGPTDSRSPCPALNALANHGHLPRDGKNLNVFQLVGALRDVYKVSAPLASVLSTGGIVLCGHGTTLDLDGLRKHNAIEHDASLVHRDLSESGGTEPTNHPDAELVDAIIKASDGKTITMDNLVHAKAIRESRANINSKAKYPNTLLSLGSHAEPILALMVMGESDDGISVERFRTFLGEERIPDDYHPRQTTGVLEVHAKTNKFMSEVDALHAHNA